MIQKEAWEAIYHIMNQEKRKKERDIFKDG